MKITYIRLENVAGIKVGLDKDFIEIDFKNSVNKIVSIQSANGTGKSVLLSSLTPFANVTSLDNRSTLSYITPQENGYKEIHYECGDDIYIIKHYYKSSKDSHSVKSYIQRNGIELNENGNVTSFNELVNIHFDLSQDMLRLMRLGTNLNSFITLTPAARKEFLGHLIEEVDMYLKIHKKISEDIRVVKVLLSSNNTNMNNCYISDIVVEEETLRKINKRVVEYEKERDNIVGRISSIQALIRENNIDDLRRKVKEAEASIIELNKTETLILKSSLQNVTTDSLVNKRNELVNKRIDIQSKINSYRISVDVARKNIERLEVSVKKVTSDNDIQSLLAAIETLKNVISGSSKVIVDFIPTCSSNDVYQLFTKLSSFNQITSMIYTFGNKPINMYLKLRQSDKSVDKFLKEQVQKNLSKLNEDDVKKLMERVFEDDGIITPNCDTQFHDCPYYRLSTVIHEIKNKLEEDTYDDETLRYIQIISNNIDNMLNELDRLVSINIPAGYKAILRENAIFERLTNKLPFFDLSGIQEYLSMLREHEIHVSNVDKLNQYEHQLLVYKNSGIDSQLNEIKELENSITFYNSNITTLTNEIQNIASELSVVDEHIGLVTRYIDGKKYQKIVESTLESTNRILAPLETSSNEQIELTYRLSSLNNSISSSREESKQLEKKITEYKRLLKESEVLNRNHKDLSIILESVSTRKGIPVLYMKTYLNKIQKLANDLLRLIYDDELRLAKFKITQDAFEIPYVKNSTLVPDVKYASQSEISLITMALSFALAHRASGKYNILLLDEIDSGLDDKNRSAFLNMLDHQLKTLHAEQCFIISHNLNSINSIPMDAIRLSDIETKSKLQNVIYE